MPYEIIRYTNLEHILKKILKISEMPHLSFYQHQGSKNESLCNFVSKNINHITPQQLYQNYKDATKQYPQIQIINTECLINFSLLNRIKNKFYESLHIQEVFELLVIGIIETKCSQSYNIHNHSIHRINESNRYTHMHLQNLVFLELYAEPIWKKHNQVFTEYLNQLYNLRILILKGRVPSALLVNSKLYGKFNDCTFTADQIEYLFLENYPISIISHFPNLKFLQIKIKQQILVHNVIQLSKYLHPNYKTLEHLVLVNTTIENNKATYVAHNSNGHYYLTTFLLTNIKVQNISNTEHNIKIFSSRSSTYQPPNNTNLIYQFLYNRDERILYPFNKSTQPLKGNNIYNINISIKEKNNTAASYAKLLTQNINHTYNQSTSQSITHTADYTYNKHNSQNLGNKDIFKINDEPFVSDVQPRIPLPYKKRKLNTDDYNLTAQTPNHILYHQDSTSTTNYDSFNNTQPGNDKPFISGVQTRIPLPHKKRKLNTDDYNLTAQTPNHILYYQDSTNPTNYDSFNNTQPKC
ncbi:hypothetical protein, partial [Ehrlichia muris]|uniref:Uncharacterized protein n=1 Tax=Ehrlichia cf. muris str. EmCRT TaxID=1359167 RepID=A0A0F3NCL7_9RICK